MPTIFLTGSLEFGFSVSQVVDIVLVVFSFLFDHFGVSGVHGRTCLSLCNLEGGSSLEFWELCLWSFWIRVAVLDSVKTYHIVSCSAVFCCIL